ncbi:serine/threonine-protein kinase [Kitasatospora sp. A2-31]|uniref:serine/threonine-protein kinase n=1 Tax=Kitasatospora sp. A2-31 TaxID=2916414 RepID=UPI001EEA6102|nr:serine/threonine-protein kinase [Kitasatospora sp. A2-31]MCG6494068.1 protein kinase [Kitasatospora sp. A2-31]
MNPGGPQPRLIDGRFELLERLGGGGMGLVWRARDNALYREVALKEVRPPDPAMAAADPDGANELRERVLREARALARLQHPNVAVIHHIVDTPEHPHPWLVMELVSGGSLADRIARGPLTVPEAARIGRGVLAALRAAHAAGIQHRDVKPGNVLLRPDGTPVLTDFGIAAMQDATALTATGALIGSPEYIAPERIRGEEGNPSSDLWSLGMMLYVAVEGHHPLRRATTLATLAAVLDEPLPPPSRSGGLGPVLAAVLARDPKLRPDADQLDRALAAAEQGAAPGTPAGQAGPAWAPTFLDTPRPGGAVSAAPGVFGPPPGDVPAHAAPPGGVPSGSWPAQGPADPTGSTYPSGSTYPTGPVPPTGSTYPIGSVGPVDAMGPTRATDPAAAPGPAKRGRTVAAVALGVATVAVAGVLVWSLNPDGAKGKDAKAAGGPAASSSAAGAGGTTTPGGSADTAAPSAGPATPAPAKSSSGGSGGGATTPAPADLLTPDGVRAVVAAVTAAAGKSTVKDLTVYPGYAMAEVPTADPRAYEWYDYRDGKATRRTPGGPMLSSKTADLTQYDWSVIPALLKKAEETLNVPSPTSRYLIIGPDISDGTPTIRVYLSSANSISGYLSADVTGKVKRTYPAQ